MPAPRFRLTPAPPPLEQDIHEQVARLLDKLLAPPAMWAAYPSGHIQLSAAEAARLTRIGLKRGLPDILIWFEALTFGIELKREGGRLSKTRIGRTRRGAPRVFVGQEEVFPMLRKAGMTIAICHSTAEVLAQIQAWGLPLRGRIAA